MPQQGAAPPEEGQTLLQRLDHWCQVQPDKVSLRPLLLLCTPVRPVFPD